MTSVGATLVVSEIFPPQTGGSGRWFWEIYRRLSRDQFVLAVGNNGDHEAFDRTHDLRVERMPLSFFTRGLISAKGLTGYFHALRRLQAMVRNESISMLHCGRCLPEGLLGLALQHLHRIPYACYVHGEELGIALTSRELRLLARLVLHHAEMVIVNSRNTEQIVTEHWDVPSERIRLLHPGVDTQRFVPAARCSQTRDKLGWGNRTVLLTVSRLQKWKGHDQMILALDAIRREFPDVLYAVVGDGEERVSLSALVEQHGLSQHVQFMGELDDADLVRCYQQCDLFLLPNRQVGQTSEGFGMVLLEAQACGKAVVAGASGGTVETMRIPQTGRVVNCDGPHPLAETVIDLLRDNEHLTRMGDAARQWTVEHFDWTALGERAQQIFQSAAPINLSFATPVQV